VSAGDLAPGLVSVSSTGSTQRLASCHCRISIGQAATSPIPDRCVVETCLPRTARAAFRTARYTDFFDQPGTISQHYQFWGTESAAAIRAPWNSNITATLKLLVALDEDAEMNRCVLHLSRQPRLIACPPRRKQRLPRKTSRSIRRMACGASRTQSKSV
jgi:hypothetical protein